MFRFFFKLGWGRLRVNDAIAALKQAMEDLETVELQALADEEKTLSKLDIAYKTTSERLTAERIRADKRMADIRNAAEIVERAERQRLADQRDEIARASKIRGNLMNLLS